MMDGNRFVKHGWKCLFSSSLCDVRVAAALARHAFDIVACVAKLRCPFCHKEFTTLHGLRSHVTQKRHCRKFIENELHKAYKSYVEDTWIHTAPTVDIAMWLKNHGAIPEWWVAMWWRDKRLKKIMHKPSNWSIL